MISPRADRSAAGKTAIIAAHALLGWLFCGALIGVGRLFLSLQATLIVHAVGAPIGFGLISLFYFTRFGFTGPFRTALVFLGVVVGMDFFVVALLIEKSFAMFGSILGTWLPFGLIFGTTYGVGIWCGQEGNIQTGKSKEV